MIKLATIAIILGSSFPAWAADESWWIECRTAERTTLIREDGSARKDVEHRPRPGEVSPDGKKLAYTVVAGAASRLVVADADGKNPHTIAANVHGGLPPSWSPDSKRIAFSSEANPGRWQAMVCDVDGANVKPVDPEEKGTTLHPKFGADGRIAYVVPSPRIGKGMPSELIVTDGKAKQVIVNAFITDFAWSPDGKRIAYSRMGSLVFHDLATSRTKEVSYVAIHPELRSHTASQIRWRPDGRSVVCAVMFMGGRMQGTHIKGDDELYVITPEGKVTELVPAGRPVDWQWAKEEPPAKK